MAFFKHRLHRWNVSVLKVSGINEVLLVTLLHLSSGDTVVVNLANSFALRTDFPNKFENASSVSDCAP